MSGLAPGGWAGIPAEEEGEGEEEEEEAGGGCGVWGRITDGGVEGGGWGRERGCGLDEKESPGRGERGPRSPVTQV